MVNRSRLKVSYVFALAAACSIISTADAQELRTYDVSCDPAAFEYLVTHPEENTPIVCSVEYNSQSWTEASLYLQSEPYLNFPKKSFIIDFDDQHPFLQRDIVNLNAQWNDPSFSREYLTYDLFNNAGLLAPYSWFVRLYVNDEYRGLYLDVEEIDERFLEREGLSIHSSVYRTDGTGCLLRLNEPIDELWIKVTNEATGYYDLAGLIAWLDTEPAEFYYEDIEAKFPLDELTRFMAVNALLGNQSTYYDNYILIHDLAEEGTWNILPWQADSCLVYSSGYEDPQYYRCGHPLLQQTNQLITRSWRNNNLKLIILDQMEGIIDSLFTESYYQQVTNSLVTLLSDAVDEDTYKQFTLINFTNILTGIPTEAANRGANLNNRMQYEPIPFDLNPAIITPGGVYFSWDRPIILDGSNATSTVEICADQAFSGSITEINAGTSTSIIYDSILPGEYYWRVAAYSPANEETRTLTFFSPFTVPSGGLGGTVVTGNITASTTWDIAGSPYSLPEGIVIDSLVVLTIDPGVIVGIGTDHHIIVGGGLTAIGNEDDSIQFVPMNPDSNWGSIFALYPSDPIDFSYISLIGASSIDSGQASQAAIKVLFAELSITDSHLRMCQNGALRAWMSNARLERVNFDYFLQQPIATVGAKIVSRYCKFSHSSLEQIHQGLIEYNGVDDSSEISYCEFYNCTDDAIDFDAANAPIEVFNCLITGCGDKGISIGDWCDEVRVSNCIITDCDIGISIYPDANAVLYNNVIAFCETGLNMTEPVTGGATTIRNTVFWENGSSNFVLGAGANLTVEYCLTDDNNPYPGQGNLNSDPLFVDPWNHYFYPQYDSPLIDAGYGTGHPEFDIIDSARVDIPEIENSGAGGIPYVDIGVYEYYDLIPGVEPKTQLPESNALLSNYPNPFNSSTIISFSMNKPGWAEVKVYDILGREVFSRRYNMLHVGDHSLFWNSESRRGSRIASGIYLCRLLTEKQSQTIKMVLIK